VHVVVRDEVPKARRQRCKNKISGQLLAEWEAQLLQPLCVTNHLDHIRSHCCALYQLALNKGLAHIEPFSPSLYLVHVLKCSNHIVRLMIFLKLHLQLGFHASEHKATHFKIVVACFLVSILDNSSCIISRLFW
jgi:hypothetical protein